MGYNMVWIDIPYTGKDKRAHLQKTNNLARPHIRPMTFMRVTWHFHYTVPVLIASEDFLYVSIIGTNGSMISKKTGKLSNNFPRKLAKKHFPMTYISYFQKNKKMVVQTILSVMSSSYDFFLDFPYDFHLLTGIHSLTRSIDVMLFLNKLFRFGGIKSPQDFDFIVLPRFRIMPFTINERQKSSILIFP